MKFMSGSPSFLTHHLLYISDVLFDVAHIMSMW